MTREMPVKRFTVVEIPESAAPLDSVEAARQTVATTAAELGIKEPSLRWFVWEREFGQALVDTAKLGADAPVALGVKSIDALAPENGNVAGFVSRPDLCVWLRPVRPAAITRTAAHEVFHVYQRRTRDPRTTVAHVLLSEAEARAFAEDFVSRLSAPS